MQQAKSEGMGNTTGQTSDGGAARRLFQAGARRTTAARPADHLLRRDTSGIGQKYRDMNPPPRITELPRGLRDRSGIGQNSFDMKPPPDIAEVRGRRGDSGGRPKASDTVPRLRLLTGFMSLENQRG